MLPRKGGGVENHDCDQRSVESKRCGTCGGWFQLQAFSVDNSETAVLGRQPQCKRCRARWEQHPVNAWKRFKAESEANEPTCLQLPDGWTMELYLARWEAAEGKCQMCGAGLREWQVSGHCLDRVINDDGHIPSNCMFLCWPCNRSKGNKPWAGFKLEMAAKLKDHGWGFVPWTNYGNFKRAKLPDVEQWRVPTPEYAPREQLSLAIAPFTGAP